ncbi:MAG: phosphate ABC transporter substrate-binding protein [Mariprofundus sp.]|nr:phosphate ABC transporter substrate-binding protein [Mariprofundus sp.]
MYRYLFISLFAITVASPVWAITIHSAGSTTVLPVVSAAAQAYHASHPNVTITVSGGGSGVGIASIVQGTAALGMASREIDEKEKAQLGDGTQVVPIAMDAVAVAVSKAVSLGGVKQLSVEQIADIYRGKINNWKEVGGPDSRILVIDKEASRGTRHVFAEAVLGNAHARAAGASIISGSNNEEQAIISRSNSAIGMLSNAWLNDEVRGIAVVVRGHGVLPSIEHVRDGSYPISRGLHVILAKDAGPEVRDFVAFLLSETGQKIVEKSGYLPVR